MIGEGGKDGKAMIPKSLACMPLLVDDDATPDLPLYLLFSPLYHHSWNFKAFLMISPHCCSLLVVQPCFDAADADAPNCRAERVVGAGAGVERVSVRGARLEFESSDPRPPLLLPPACSSTAGRARAQCGSEPHCHFLFSFPHSILFTSSRYRETT